MESTSWWAIHGHWFWIVLIAMMVFMFMCSACRRRGKGVRRWCPGSRSGCCPCRSWRREEEEKGGGR